VASAEASLARDWHDILLVEAAGYAAVAIENIGRDFPSLIVHLMTEPGDFPQRPSDRTPVFSGSLDWHSCVEMHWLLVRLLRLVPDYVPAGEMRTLLTAQFDVVGLASEARFVGTADGRSERPYGWAWALALVHEVAALAAAGDADARAWLTALEPLEAALVYGFTEWLPKATYPVRYGVHANSAFAFGLLLPYARERAPGLAETVTTRALDWFGGDVRYSGWMEPSGHDFLSPALTEAELMSRLVDGSDFASWLEAFLPALAERRPRSLFTPAIVSDPTEGQIAHLHGLNASRGWCWRRIAESLPAGDARVEPAVAAARTHLEAALPHVSGSDYMVEHWLAAYAVLALS
jgi:Protein of unknown function (DUF2891)